MVPLDHQLVSLAIAARLVLWHVRARDYIDAEELLSPGLLGTARSIAGLVPLFRLRQDGQPARLRRSEALRVEAADLDAWAIRRGDLRTAVLRLGSHR